MFKADSLMRCAGSAIAGLFQGAGLVAVVSAALCLGTWFWSLVDIENPTLWLLLPAAMFLLVCGTGALLAGLIVKGQFETLPAVREDCHE